MTHAVSCLEVNIKAGRAQAYRTLMEDAFGAENPGLWCGFTR